ncbi:MAG TPA: hypothetical protein VFK44_02610 [Bacillales bacterium]|nr:hypothetical protein [Bacillales bacterium]
MRKSREQADQPTTEKVAPGIKVSSQVGSEIANDRKATKEERKKGEYTKVVNLSND